MLAVTTFSPEGYDLYGRRCLTTLAKHFPGKVVAYYDRIPEQLVERVEYRDLMPIVSEFLERLKRHPGADGKTDGYDYRYDAVRFCRKVFAQDAVFDEDQYVFWFDADTLVLQDMPEDFLRGMLGGALAYLGRKGPQTYTETGFLGFNTKHPEFQQFRDKYLSYFTTGRIFSQLKGWHDCIAFDYAREGVSGLNLSPQGRNMDNVVIQSRLAPYLAHLKGNRKFSEIRAKKFLEK